MQIFIAKLGAIDNNYKYRIYNANGGFTGLEYEDLKHDKKSGLIAAKKNDKIGVINKFDSIILPIEYKSIYFADSNIIFALTDNGFWNSFDKSGALKLLKPKQIKNVGSNRYIYYENKKIGLMSSSGRPIAATKYNAVGLKFCNNLLAVRAENNAWGFIDTNGIFIIQPNFDLAFDFREGLAPILIDGRWGFVNDLDSLVIKPQYLSVGSRFNEGLACVEVDSGFIYIDKRGNQSILGTFRSGSPFLDGVAEVTVATGNGISKMIHIDKHGNEIERELNTVELIDNNRRIVSNGSFWGIIDSNNYYVIPPKYLNIRPMSGNLFDVLVDANVIIRDSDGLVDKSDYKRGVIDTCENVIVSFDYVSIHELSEGLISLKDNKGHIFLVDVKGKPLLPFEIHNIYQCDPTLFVIEADSKKGLFYSTEQYFIAPEYDEIANPRDKWVIVMKNGKWGWVDHRGNVMIPCRYDAVTPFNSYDEKGYATVLQFGMQFRINTKGEMIWRIGPAGDN